MKATGIVRRVDDLGRIVIPKEIRRTLKIREGDPLEIYTEKDGGVIFRKYSPMGDMQDLRCSSANPSGRLPATWRRCLTGTASSPFPARPSGSCWTSPTPRSWTGSWSSGRTTATRWAAACSLRRRVRTSITWVWRRRSCARAT